MNFLSLFAGIGGFDLGLERSGMTCVAQCEYDKTAREVLQKHWPDVPCYHDVRTLTGEQLERDGITVDLICGGFPCQPFSFAGKRGGEEDNRHLWPEMLRIVQEVRPVWIVGENVTGLLSVELLDSITRVENKTIIQDPNYNLYQASIIREADMLFDELCRELEEEGYDVLPLLIPACAVDAKHRRDRVWILAHSDKRSGETRAERTRWEAGSDISGRCERTNVADTSSRRRSGPEERENQFPGRTETISPSENVAYPTSERRGETRQLSAKPSIGITGPGSAPADVADTSGHELQGRAETRNAESGWSHPNKFTAGRSERSKPGNWLPEPGMGRVATGVPGRVDRLKQLGNAVVPQVVEVIGRTIMEAHHG